MAGKLTGQACWCAIKNIKKRENSETQRKDRGWNEGGEQRLARFIGPNRPTETSIPGDQGSGSGNKSGSKEASPPPFVPRPPVLRSARLELRLSVPVRTASRGRNECANSHTSLTHSKCSLAAFFSRTHLLGSKNLFAFICWHFCRHWDCLRGNTCSGLLITRHELIYSKNLAFFPSYFLWSRSCSGAWASAHMYFSLLCYWAFEFQSSSSYQAFLASCSLFVL